MLHPLNKFVYCPVCGEKAFEAKDEKSKQCARCGFTYYFNPSASVACFIRNDKNEFLIVRRAKEPAKGTLDLPGGFLDSFETAEDAVKREVREETGLEITECRYLFSLPNIYPYMGFDVHTLDMFFECISGSFDKLRAGDDAAEIVIIPQSEINAEDFGLESIKKAVSLYNNSYICARKQDENIIHY